MAIWTIYGYEEISTKRFWYVGQTKNPGKRDAQHRFHDSPRVFDTKVLRCRPADFRFAILCDGISTKADANYWENFYMVYLKTWCGFGPCGYNLCFALSGPPTDSGLAANAEAHRRAEYTASIRKRTISLETREKMRKAARFRIAKYGHPWSGRHHSEITKERIGKYHKGKTLSVKHMTAITRQDIPTREVADLYLYGFELGEIARMYGVFGSGGHPSDAVIRNRLRWAGVRLRPRRSPREWTRKRARP